MPVQRRFFLFSADLFQHKDPDLGQCQSQYIIDKIDDLKYTIDTVSNEYNKLRQLYSDKNKLNVELEELISVF